jgi:ATP synthase protein I
MDQLPQRSKSSMFPVPLTVYRVVALQMLVVIILSFSWFFFSKRAAFSVLLGGSSVVLPSLYLAWRLTSRPYARQVKQIVRTFYFGETVKLLMMAILVVLLTTLFEVPLLPFFCGFAVTQVGTWIALLAMH